jgi:hypothetical protein
VEINTAPLLDAYDVYQHLLDDWAETIQDDCYLIAADGWREAALPRLIVEDKTKKEDQAGLYPRQEKIPSRTRPTHAYHPALVCGRTGDDRHTGSRLRHA